MAYVVTSKIKEFIKAQQLNTASDFADALDKKVEQLIMDAANRAKSNQRRTVRAGDL